MVITINFFIFKSLVIIPKTRTSCYPNTSSNNGVFEIEPYRLKRLSTATFPKVHLG